MTDLKRLKLILSLAQRKEDQAALALTKIQNLLQQHQQRVQALEIYQREYQMRFAGSNRWVGTGGQLQNDQAFCAHLQTVIEKQRHEMKLLSLEHAKTREQWSTHYQYRQAVERRLQESHQQYLQAEDKREQREVDDLVSRRRT